MAIGSSYEELRISWSMIFGMLSHRHLGGARIAKPAGSRRYEINGGDGKGLLHSEGWLRQWELSFLTGQAYAASNSEATKLASKERNPWPRP